MIFRTGNQPLCNLYLLNCKSNRKIGIKMPFLGGTVSSLIWLSTSVSDGGVWEDSFRPRDRVLHPGLPTLCAGQSHPGGSGSTGFWRWCGEASRAESQGEGVDRTQHGPSDLFQQHSYWGQWRSPEIGMKSMVGPHPLCVHCWKTFDSNRAFYLGRLRRNSRGWWIWLRRSLFQKVHHPYQRRTNQRIQPATLTEVKYYLVQSKVQMTLLLLREGTIPHILWFTWLIFDEAVS